MAPKKATSVKIEAPKSPGRPKRAAATKKIATPTKSTASKKTVVKKSPTAKKSPGRPKKAVADKKSPPAKKPAAVKKPSIKKTKKDDNQPKRTNAYLLWSKDNHERAIEEYGSKKYRKKLGEEWKKMSEGDKAPYQEEASTMMAEYHRLVEATK